MLLIKKGIEIKKSPKKFSSALNQKTLFMLFEAATVYAGALFGVDPLDQPGVELGKRLTYGLLGRPGFSAPSFGNVDPRWRV